MEKSTGGVSFDISFINSGSDAENYLDFDKLNIAARRRPTNRVVMRSMFSCYSSLLWYANTKGIVNEV